MKYSIWILALTFLLAACGGGEQQQDPVAFAKQQQREQMLTDISNLENQMNAKPDTLDKALANKMVDAYLKFYNTNSTDTISAEMTHQGEKGRNNEAILVEFLRRLLPTRYTVSTGKVVGVGGHESGQMDVIIHDRLDTPAFKEAQAWSIVPVESVHAVISVKTTLTKPELRDRTGANTASATARSSVVLPAPFEPSTTLMFGNFTFGA